MRRERIIFVVVVTAFLGCLCLMGTGIWLARRGDAAGPTTLKLFGLDVSTESLGVVVLTVSGAVLILLVRPVWTLLAASLKLKVGDSTRCPHVWRREYRTYISVCVAELHEIEALVRIAANELSQETELYLPEVRNRYVARLAEPQLAARQAADAHWIGGASGVHGGALPSFSGMMRKVEEAMKELRGEIADVPSDPISALERAGGLARRLQALVVQMDDLSAVGLAHVASPESVTLTWQNQDVVQKAALCDGAQ